jgi:aminopeptidase N
MKNIILSTLVICCAAMLQAQHEYVRNTCHHVDGFHKSKKLSDLDHALIQKNNARSDTFDIQHYEIHMDVTDYNGEYIEANTIVTVSPKMAGLESIRLDLKDLAVDSIHLDGMSAEYAHVGESIFVDFFAPTAIGDVHDIHVWYQGHPYQDPQWGGVYFEQNYIYNLGIGLSTIPPNFGRVWYPCFDTFVERATYEWHITSADGFHYRGQGDFLGQVNHAGDTLTRSYAMTTPLPTYLTNFACADYDSIGFTHMGANGPVPVELYCKSNFVSAMEARFASMGDVIDALEHWWGPHAWSRVGYVMTTVGAMEHPTNIAYPQSMMNQSVLSNEGLYAHELGHHWWGDMVSPEIHNHMWLKEGGAEYSQHLARNFISGEEAFIDEVKDNHLFVIESAHIDDEGYWPMSPMPDEHIYGRTTYNKGASVWHNLRAYLGDSLYRVGSKAVLDSFYLETINPETFKDVLSWSTGVPLDDFINDHVYKPGFSSFEIDSVVSADLGGGMFEHTLFLEQKLRECPSLYNNVPLDITFLDADWNRHVMQVYGSGQYTVATLTTDFEPIATFLNAEARLNQAKMDVERVLTQSSTLSSMPYVQFLLSVPAVEDSSLLRIEHQWVAPDNEALGDNIIEISSTHYWNVGGLWEDGLHVGGRFIFQGGSSTGLDNDLAGITEEQMGLVWRPNAATPWEIYPYYAFLSGADDGNGAMNVDSLLQGQYTFANIDMIIGLEEDFQTEDQFNIYPNPSDGMFYLDTDAAGKYRLEVRDVSGRVVLSDQSLLSSRDRYKIDISGEAKGVYTVNVYTDLNKRVMSKQVVIH